MKKFLVIHLLMLICVESSYCQEYIEPQWKFYFAFEDATNAKDTLWLVLDSSATFWNSWVPPYTNGWDPQFGEIPVELNEGVFNVWTYNYEEPFNPNPPKFKVVAYPIIFSPDAQIYANNYVLPITLSWDTALFRAPVLMQMNEGPINAPLLDNDYFFNYHAHYGWPSYSMLYDTQVEMPWFSWWSQVHFPLMCSMSRGWGNPLSNASILPEKLALKLYPNPVADWLRVESMANWAEFWVLNAQGMVVLKGSYNAVQPGVHVGSLPTGAYILRLVDSKGKKVAAARFVKVE